MVKDCTTCDKRKMTKYEKIMTMDINTLAKWLKQFSEFKGEWQTLRLWLESDGNVGLLDD